MHPLTCFLLTHSLLGLGSCVLLRACLTVHASRTVQASDFFVAQRQSSTTALYASLKGKAHSAGCRDVMQDCLWATRQLLAYVTKLDFNKA